MLDRTPLLLRTALECRNEFVHSFFGKTPLDALDDEAQAREKTSIQVR